MIIYDLLGPLLFELRFADSLHVFPGRAVVQKVSWSAGDSDQRRETHLEVLGRCVSRRSNGRGKMGKGLPVFPSGDMGLLHQKRLF